MSLVPSLSSSVTVAVICWSSVKVPLIATLPTSLMFETVMVNSSVSVLPSPSDAVITTAVVPTFASAGVPESVPVPSPASEIDSHEPDPHPVLQVRVIVPELGAPSSASVDAIEYEYNESSVPVVVPDVDITGSSDWSYVQAKVLEAVLLFPAASVKVPAATEILVAPEVVGVKVAVYAVPEPANEDRDPPETVTSSAANPVVDSLVVNASAMLASLVVEPEVTPLVLEAMAIVSAVES